MGYCGSQTSFSLNVADLYQHAWLHGQTGVGKSTVLLSIVHQLARAGHGLTLVDFNGDLATQLPHYLPPARRDDLVYSDFSDTENVLPINPFYQIPPDRRSAVATDFTDATKHIFIDSWGERMDHALTNIVAGILDAPDNLRPTFLSIAMVIADKEYRRKIAEHIQDGQVAEFFELELPRYLASKNQEWLSPIENKIKKITQNQHARNVLSPYQPKYQFKNAIPRKSILVIRLSKGVLGQRTARLLGTLAVSALLNAAREQDILPYEERVPHFLCIDELQHVVSGALATAFSEHRHYKMGIIGTTQYTEQISAIDRTLLASMFGNIGTLLAFRSSNTDARLLSEQIGEFAPQQFTGLGLGEMRVRQLADGNVVVPFKAFSDRDHIQPHDRGEEFIKHVRQRYTVHRQHVEEQYARWMRKQLIDPAEVRREKKDLKERRASFNKYRAIIPQSPTGVVRFEPLSRSSDTDPPDRHGLMKKPTRRKRGKRKNTTN